MRNQTTAVAAVLMVILGAGLGASCGSGTPATPVGPDGLCAAGTLLCVLGGAPPGTVDACCPASVPTLCAQKGMCQPTCEDEDGVGSPQPCVQQCTDASQCSGDRPACDLSLRLCVQCTDSSFCGGATPACDQTICVQCTDSSQCSGATPACDVKLTNTCVQCTDSSQCSGSTPFCETIGGTCVECLDAEQCPGTMQSCWTGKCAPCLTAGARCDDEAQCCSDQCGGGRCG